MRKSPGDVVRFCFPIPVLALAILFAIAAHAQDTPGRIVEIMAGANGDSRVQFIVIEQDETERSLWGPQGEEVHSRVQLVFFDGVGRETGIFRFPVDPPTGGTLETLVATEAFSRLPGAPPPDIVIPPLVPPLSGRVCLQDNPMNPQAPAVDECVAYGELPITDARSLRREGDGWELTTSPTPRNTSGETFAIPVRPLVTQGEALFNNETFSGNGRTCSTCHVEADGFGLLPGNVEERFEGLVDGSWDPLFLAESRASGFDFNLNTLEIVRAVPTPAPCTGELRGDIRDETGTRARVLARTGPTTYLVFGGLEPGLAGFVTDGVCNAEVRNVIQGDLNNLEDPGRMRDPRRTLILEHVDGFENPSVFRRSPHLLNLAYTAPYGLSGEFPDLRSFSEGAVLQHFPRTLDRETEGDDPDVRIPTERELGAIEAFLLAQEFPPGDDPDKFDPSRFATTSQQRRGLEEFVTFGCAVCHGGPVLAETTHSVQGKDIGINAAFDTGTADPSLPCEPGSSEIGACGSREFSTPQLFNLPNLGPLFHNGTAGSVRDAVDFYLSGEFSNSPPNLEFIATGIGIVSTDAITAFLEGLVLRTYALGETEVRLTPEVPEETISVANRGTSPLAFSLPACRLTGADANAFRILECPLDIPLASGETREIRIELIPNSTGGETAILEVWPIADAPSGVELVSASQ